MGLLTKIFIIYIMVTIGLYLFTFDNTIIGLDPGTLFDNDLLHNKKGFGVAEGTQIANPTGNYTTSLTNLDIVTQKIEIGSGSWFITDIINLLWGFIKTLLNIATMVPYSLFALDLPMEINYIVILPMLLLFILGVVYLIRGGSGGQ